MTNKENKAVIEYVQAGKMLTRWQKLKPYLKGGALVLTGAALGAYGTDMQIRENNVVLSLQSGAGALLVNQDFPKDRIHQNATALSGRIFDLVIDMANEQNFVRVTACTNQEVESKLLRQKLEQGNHVIMDRESDRVMRVYIDDILGNGRILSSTGLQNRALLVGGKNDDPLCPTDSTIHYKAYNHTTTTQTPEQSKLAAQHDADTLAKVKANNQGSTSLVESAAGTVNSTVDQVISAAGAVKETTNKAVERYNDGVRYANKVKKFLTFNSD